MIKYVPVSNSRNVVFIDHVLSQLNKDYQVTVKENEIYLLIGKTKKIKDVFIELKELINRENGFIRDYNIKRRDKDILLTLFVNVGIEKKNELKILVKKKYPDEQNEQDELPLFKEKSGDKPKICIIIDDAGYNSKLIDDYIKLPVKIGIAVLPFVKNSKKISKMIYENNKEVLLHMPMEPENYKKRNIRLMPKAIWTSMSRTEIYNIMDDMLADIQYAAGINNHQGSRAASDKRTMAAVLSKVKTMNMFFIDSLTSDKSVSEELARELGVNYGIRNVFLDNKNEYNYIKNQMERLIEIALKKGKAVGIGHIDRDNTYRVIKEYIPYIQSRGIEIVYPSEIINKFYHKEVTNNVKENNIYFN